MHALRILHLALIACLLLPAAMGLAAPRERGIGVGGLVQVNYTRVEIGDLVRTLGRATSQKILIDDSVRGTISVVAKRKVTQQVALQILESALQLKGFGLIEGPAGVLKIVPVNASVGEAPLRQQAGPGEAPMVILQSLDHADPEEVVRIMQPLVGPGGLMLAYPDTDTVIIGGPERRVARLMTLIRALDVDTRRELFIRTLRNRDVSSAVEMLEERFSGRENALEQFDVWLDERTNRLILRATREVYEEVDAYLATIDGDVAGEGGINVIRVLYRDAADVADIIERQRSAGSGAGAGPGSVVGLDGDPDALENVAELATRDFTVAVDEGTRSLIVRSDGDTLGLIRDLVSILDQPARMVDLDVLIYEIDTPRSWEVELDLVATLSESTSNISPTDTFVRLRSDPQGDGVQSVASEGLFAGLQRYKIQIPFVAPDGSIQFMDDALYRASFVAAETNARSSLVARPHLAMISGEEHEIFVGDNVPVPVARAQPEAAAGTADPGVVSNPVVAAQNTVATRQTIERTDVGTLLRVTPTIGAEGNVRLEMKIELSRVAPSVAGAIENVGPTFKKRDLTVNTTLRSGEYAVLGLYEEDIESHVVSGIPYLRDLPVLGWLFRGEKRASRTSRLVIAVKADVLGDADALLLSSIRRRIAFERVNSEADRLQVDEPYAVLVTTRTREDDAQTIAESLELKGFRPRIKRWQASDEIRFDVYVIGFESMADAGEVAVALAEEGWDPDVVVASSPTPIP